MKKLTIAVATVALAIGVNAATVSWTTMYEISDGTSDGITAASMAYLIDASVLTQDSIYSSVSGGKSLADAIGANSVASASLTGGKIATQNLTLDVSGSKTYYMALFDSDIGDNGAIYFSEQIDKSISSVGKTSFQFQSDSSMNAVAASMDGFSASSGGWVAVPEPTSGLLLVLGMAGLMLRRRRA